MVWATTWFPMTMRASCLIFHSVRRIQYGVHDLQVTPAAAEVAGQVVLDLVGGRRRVLLKQGFGGQDEAGGAVRTLERGVVDEGLLDRVKAAVLGERLDGHDRLVGNQHAEQQAGADRLAFQQDRAGATHPDPAPLAHTEQLEFAAQYVEQSMVRRDGHLLLAAVDVEPNEPLHGASASALSTFSGVSGRSVIRTPRPRATALAMAGMTGGTEVSPIPCISLTPGCSKIRVVSWHGRSSNDGIM